jgi:sulfoxide reductase heme-binding subunit YedZ
LLSPHPDPGVQALIWELIRGSGILAYVMLSVSTLLGMAISMRALDWLTKRSHVYEGHQSISIVALAFTCVHGTALIFDKYIGFSVADILIPFAAGWRPIAVALGIVSFYTLAIVTGTSYVRRHIGQRAWRTIHYSSFVAWGFAALHGVTAGSDSGSAWVQVMYVTTVGAVVTMLALRLMLLRLPPAQQDARLA